MPNSQYPSYPTRDWSSEISYPPMGAHSTTASTSTTTTTTATASSHSGAPGAQAAATAPAVQPGMASGSSAQAGMASGPAAQTGVASGSAAQAGMASGPAAQTGMASGPAAQTGMASSPAAQAGMASGTTAPMTNQQRLPLVQTAPRSEFEGSIGTLDLQTHQPIEVIEAPTTMNEAFLGSLKSMLLRNRGNFVSATFLIGTQGTTAWEGILHDVGNDYVIIFQPGRQRYIACDIYSLKYIEFYDTHRQEMCDNILRQNIMF